MKNREMPFTTKNLGEIDFAEIFESGTLIGSISFLMKKYESLKADGCFNLIVSQINDWDDGITIYGSVRQTEDELLSENERVEAQNEAEYKKYLELKVKFESLDLL